MEERPLGAGVAEKRWRCGGGVLGERALWRIEGALTVWRGRGGGGSEERLKIAHCGGMGGVLAEEDWRGGDGVVQQLRRKEPGEADEDRRSA